MPSRRIQTLEATKGIISSVLSAFDTILGILDKAQRLEDDLVSMGVSRVTIGARVQEILDRADSVADTVSDLIAETMNTLLNSVEFRANYETGNYIEVGSNGTDRKINLYRFPSSYNVDINAGDIFELFNMSNSSLNGYYKISSNVFGAGKVSFTVSSSYGNAGNISTSGGFTQYYEGSWILRYQSS